MLETDEFVAGNSEGIKMDMVTFTTAYQKMKSLCHNIRNEIFTDIEIHNHHILPRYFVVSGPAVHLLETVHCIRSEKHSLQNDSVTLL